MHKNNKKYMCSVILEQSSRACKRSGKRSGATEERWWAGAERWAGVAQNKWAGAERRARMTEIVELIFCPSSFTTCFLVQASFVHKKVLWRFISLSRLFSYNAAKNNLRRAMNSRHSQLYRHSSRRHSAGLGTSVKHHQNITHIFIHRKR